jgi:hypothetical protein
LVVHVIFSWLSDLFCVIILGVKIRRVGFHFIYKYLFFQTASTSSIYEHFGTHRDG